MTEPVAPGMASTVSIEILVERVHGNRDRLAGVHLSQLAFLEIRRHPQIAQIGERDEALAFADVFADFDRALADDSRHRRDDLAIAEIELRVIELRLHGLHVGLLGLQVRPGNGDLIGRVHSGRFHHAARLIELRPALLHDFLRGLGRGARGIDGSGSALAVATTWS